METEIFDSRMLFWGLDDFVAKRVKIRSLFLCKGDKYKFVYKLYIYSRPFISETWKDFIFDYLWNDISEMEFMSAYTKMKSRNNKKKNIE